MPSSPISPHSEYFRPEALKRIHKLELRARFIMEGLLSGRHKSPFFGQSLEFAQHRQYAAGDDLRRIDWKVWGRQDRFFVKQYEDETNLRAALLVDCSRSMHYSRSPESMTKFDYAATLAVSIAWQLLRQQDTVGGFCFDSQIRQIIPQRTNRNHLNSLIQALETIGPQDKTAHGKDPGTDQTDLGSVLLQAAETFPKRGLICLFSDLFTPRPSLWKGLKLLRSRGHDILVFHILDDDELEFTFQGPTRFVGLEGPSTLRCNPRALRDGYLEAMSEFLDEIRHGCAANRTDYALVRTSDPFDQTLSGTLLKRRHCP
ncbi:MAG: DUF58 domain-containing protein [Thermoguttaceae bacterium]|nr:DUF58 domain-containing protein [Thermoguttaceae bacterium]